MHMVRRIRGFDPCVCEIISLFQLFNDSLSFLQHNTNSLNIKPVLKRV